MKIILIGDKVLAEEKILKFLSGEEKVINADNPEKVYLYDSPYKIKELLNELKIRNRSIDKIKSSDSDNEVVIIINNDKPDQLINKKYFKNQSSEILEYKNIKILVENEEVYFNNRRIRIHWK